MAFLQCCVYTYLPALSLHHVQHWYLHWLKPASVSGTSQAMPLANPSVQWLTLHMPRLSEPYLSIHLTQEEVPSESQL